jgi:hypothetical protein
MILIVLHYHHTKAIDVYNLFIYIFTCDVNPIILNSLGLLNESQEDN